MKNNYIFYGQCCLKYYLNSFKYCDSIKTKESLVVYITIIV